MIELDNVTVVNGGFTIAGASLTIPTGAYGILMGKTGCGKTTLLEAVCGLKPVSAGCIRLLGRDVTRAKPAERGIGYVPQDRALFSTMTVREHLAFALHLRRWRRREMDRRIAELAALLDIEPLLERKPHGLSGGEAQRVALGRALSFEPRVLCLDEPQSALDHDTRLDMCALLERVKERLSVTVLHITHDRNEAARLADRLFEVDGGVVRLVAAPSFPATVSR